jgi:hypothetical protein
MVAFALTTVPSQPPVTPGVDPPPGIRRFIQQVQTTHSLTIGYWLKILPNEELEKEIKKALGDAGCGGSCKLFNYACAVVYPKDLEEFLRNRKQIKKNTGCRVFGLYREYYVTGGPSNTNSMNCNRWTRQPIFGPEIWPACNPAFLWEF